MTDIIEGNKEDTSKYVRINVSDIMGVTVQGDVTSIKDVPTNVNNNLENMLEVEVPDVANQDNEKYFLT